MNKIFTERKCLTLEEVDLYFKEELSSLELADIENHLLDCKLCSDALEGLKTDISILNKLPQSFTPVTENMLEEPKLIPLVKPKTWMRLAATISLLIIIGAIGFYYINKPDIGNLYSKYFTPIPPSNSALRGEGAELKKPDDEAILAYGLQEYDRAIPLLKDLLKKDPHNFILQMYLGISYLELNELDVAIKTLKEVKLNSKEYSEDADWFLSLAYLKTKDIETTRSILTEINKKDNDYSQKAKELLTRLGQ